MLGKIIAPCLVLSALAFAQDAPSVGKIFDHQLTSMESEVVPLAEAMPAEKYGFAPKDGAFQKVRTFALQVKHIATVNYEVAAAILGEAMPVDAGENENGAAKIQSKDQIVAYLKQSFAYTHKAMQSVTQENLLEQVQNAFGKDKVPRLSMVTIPVWHSFDHYGQMVVYARMNSVVPPASR